MSVNYCRFRNLDAEAIQFTGDNQKEIEDFLQEHDLVVNLSEDLVDEENEHIEPEIGMWFVIYEINFNKMVLWFDNDAFRDNFTERDVPDRIFITTLV